MVQLRGHEGQDSHANERKLSEGALAVADGLFDADSGAARVRTTVAVGTLFANGATTGRPTV